MADTVYSISVSAGGECTAAARGAGGFECVLGRFAHPDELLAWLGGRLGALGPDGSEVESLREDNARLEHALEVARRESRRSREDKHAVVRSSSAAWRELAHSRLRMALAGLRPESGNPGYDAVLALVRSTAQENAELRARLAAAGVGATEGAAG